MKSNKCVILIPIYKEEINCEEYMSISNTINLYNNKYDIFFMCDNKLNTYNYDMLFNIKTKYKKYNYNNSDEYSNLLLNPDFYKEYLKYDFMFIVQPDACIFKGDLLEYYLDKKYPYIGPITTVSFIDFMNKYHIDYDDLIDIIIKDIYEKNGTIKDLKNATLKYKDECFIGMNGGLSLRRIDIFYHLLSKYKIHGVEDVAISNLLLKDINLLDNLLIKDIINFGIEHRCLPIYQKYKIIPFGTHKSLHFFIENIQ